MTQELIDLKASILEGRYDDALVIIDELEGMSKQATLRSIESILVRLLVHLSKNQIEQRLTNSWLASISDSIVQISKLNLKDNKISYYIKSDDWQSYLEEAVERAIRPASVEVLEGQLKPKEVAERINRKQLIEISQRLLDLTYEYSAKDLPAAIDTYLAELPGGDWLDQD